MKLFFITLLTLGSIFTKAAPVNHGHISEAVIRSFQHSFAAAKEVTWEQYNELYKAKFALNGQYLTAFFTAEGELFAVTKNILSTQLPVLLQVKLKSCHNNFWITDLFELSNEEGVTYFVTLENADNKLVLKSDANSGWLVYKKKVKL